MPIKVITRLEDVPSDIRSGILGAVDATVSIVSHLTDEEKANARKMFDADLDNAFNFALVGVMLMDLAKNIKEIDENEEYKIVG